MFFLLGAAMISGCEKSTPASPPENTEPIKLFGRNSYFPLIAGARWIYNNGDTVLVTEIDLIDNSFYVKNLNTSGELDGEVGSDNQGFYAWSYANEGSGFIGLQMNNWGGNVRGPRLAFEDSWMTVGFSWIDDIYVQEVSWWPSSEYVCTNYCTITSKDGMITTAGGQTYSG